MPRLVVRDLTTARLGLANIGFELRAGEVLGLAGLVGAGRSELAACLFGLERIDAGTIELDGRPFHPRSPRDAIERGVVLVPEDRAANGLVLAATVRENAALPWLARLASGGLLAADREGLLAQRVVSAMGVRATLEARAGSLSGGNQQKLALGKWLVEPPRVLILDEPTQGIDVAGRAEIHARIGGLAAGGVAILLVSSDLGECLALSDRVAVLRRGRLAGTLAGERLRAEDVLALALGVEGTRA
jgi:ABC-type sugar transport system ATPase subunit